VSAEDAKIIIEHFKESYKSGMDILYEKYGTWSKHYTKSTYICDAFMPNFIKLYKFAMVNYVPYLLDHLHNSNILYMNQYIPTDKDYAVESINYMYKIRGRKNLCTDVQYIIKNFSIDNLNLLNPDIFKFWQKNKYHRCMWICFSVDKLEWLYNKGFQFYPKDLILCKNQPNKFRFILDRIEYIPPDFISKKIEHFRAPEIEELLKMKKLI